MFLDRVTIFIRAGDGGAGAATFRREAHVPLAEADVLRLGLAEEGVPVGVALREGGTGTKSESPIHPPGLPERLEAGTVNVSGGTTVLGSPGRLNAAATVNVSWNEGSDSGSGLGSVQIRRSEAAYSGGSCGAFGPFGNVRLGCDGEELWCAMMNGTRRAFPMAERERLLKTARYNLFGLRAERAFVPSC